MKNISVSCPIWACLFYWKKNNQIRSNILCRSQARKISEFFGPLKGLVNWTGLFSFLLKKQGTRKVCPPVDYLLTLQAEAYVNFPDLNYYSCIIADRLVIYLKVSYLKLFLIGRSILEWLNLSFNISYISLIWLLDCCDLCLPLKSFGNHYAVCNNQFNYTRIKEWKRKAYVLVLSFLILS